MPTKKQRPIFLTLMIAVMACFALLPIVLNLRVSRSVQLASRSFNPIYFAINEGWPTEEILAIIENDPAALQSGAFGELVVEAAMGENRFELFEPFAANGIHLDGAFHTGTEFRSRPHNSPLVRLVNDGKIEGVQALLLAARNHDQSPAQLDKAMVLARQNRHEEIHRALQSHKEMTQ